MMAGQDKQLRPAASNQSGQGSDREQNTMNFASSVPSALNSCLILPDLLRRGRYRCQLKCLWQPNAATWSVSSAVQRRRQEQASSPRAPFVISPGEEFVTTPLALCNGDQGRRTTTTPANQPHDPRKLATDGEKRRKHAKIMSMWLAARVRKEGFYSDASAVSFQ